MDSKKLLDLINNMEKKKFREEIILEEVKKQLVNDIWPDKDDVDINYDFHEGQGENNELL